MALDYLNGRPIERDAVLGSVVAIAKRHGIAVPHLNTVLVTLRMRAALEGRDKKQLPTQHNIRFHPDVG